jgi:hypothetical protein
MWGSGKAETAPFLAKPVGKTISLAHIETFEATTTTTTFSLYRLKP